MYTLNKLQEWINPENRYRFISINRFAQLLGIKQTAVMDLVKTKRIDSIVVQGKTFIPLRTKYFSLLGIEYGSHEDSWADELWSLTQEGRNEQS